MIDALPYIGIGTPQANPTVEREASSLLAGHAAMQVTRLTSTDTDPSNRLREYFDQIPTAIASFDTLPLRNFAFACTGSSYLLPAGKEDSLVQAMSADCGVTVITATQAIFRELQLCDCTEIALLTPYPSELADAAVAYWEDRGIRVAHTARMDIGPDTRKIYELAPTDVQDTLSALQREWPGLILISGTGMASLELLQSSNRIISSNLCLFSESLRNAGVLSGSTQARSLIRGNTQSA